VPPFTTCTSFQPLSLAHHLVFFFLFLPLPLYTDCFFGFFNAGLLLEFDETEQVEFTTSGDVDVISTFDEMGLREDLLRGIYQYGEDKLIFCSSPEDLLRFFVG
jgi:hypothetical protein